MPCAECERLQLFSRGAICADCADTRAYLASQDEARLVNAHKELRRLFSTLHRIQNPDQERLRVALSTGDPCRIIHAVTAALNSCRDEAAHALNVGHNVVPQLAYVHELPSQRAAR